MRLCDRAGKEFVEADATDLPFPPKSFDFVYCSHTADLGQFFREIQRVGKAGYIETPNYLLEQMVGTTTHAWALWVEDGVLHAEKKWVAGAPPRVYHTMHGLIGGHPVLACALLLLPEFDVMRFWWKDSFRFELHEAPVPSLPTKSAVTSGTTCQ